MSTITPALHLRIHELIRGGYRIPDVSSLLRIDSKDIRRYSKIAVPGDQYSAVSEHKLHRQYEDLLARYNRLVKDATLFDTTENFIAACLNRPINFPAWTRTATPGKKHVAIPTLDFSDWHYDENVNPEEVNGLNGYGRALAVKRTHNCFENTLKMSFDFLKGLTYEGIVVAMLGDIFSGDIHDELVETNEATMMESLLYYLDPVGSGLKMLADEFGRVVVPVVVGNHPRTSRKPRAKRRVTTNYDWLFAQFLARLFSLDHKYKDKVIFNISKAADLRYPIYDTYFVNTHGDQFKGGSGIAGALSPLMIGYHRKLKRAITTGQPFQYMNVGHWHQLMYFKGIIANGAGKGYDEYCFTQNFEYEKARQALFMVQPGHGVTFTDHVHCESDDEPWKLAKTA